MDFSFDYDNFKNLSDSFWVEIGDKLIWTKKWDKLLDLSDEPISKWYVGGELNLCYNSLDRHVKDGLGNETVILFDSPVTETKRNYTYNDIYEQVTRLSSVLKSMGVEKGDRVLIYMPMIVEGVFAMLACCRIGAIHCAMPSGLPAQDLAQKIDHCKPKVVLTATHGYHANGWVNYKDILDEAINKSLHPPLRTLVFKRHELGFDAVNLVSGRDEDWVFLVESATPMETCQPMEATEPAFAIYTSGSTGKPKAIVHPVGGFAARLTCHAMLFFKCEDVIFMSSNFGWIAEHVCVYMSLLSRVKVVIYEGDCLLTSDVHALYRLITENSVTRPVLRPGIFKIIRSMDPEGTIASQYNFDKVRHVSVTGEPIDQSTLKWVMDIFKRPVASGYGQTELSITVAGFLSEYSNCSAVAGILLPGWNVVIMKSDNTNAKPNEMGRILIRLPLPPGGLVTLLDNHEKCKADYFTEYPGYFDTKDNGYLDDEGKLVVESRADDLMKHASVYLAAQAVEEVVMNHPDVVECVVIPVPDLILKEVPVILFIPSRYASKSSNEISKEILEKVSDHFGVAVTFREPIAIKELPRTRTGKVHRPSLRALVKGLQIQESWPIENPEVLKDIQSVLRENGYSSEN